MSITRDQLRAARVLLHLQQKQLADLSEVSLSTIRRFEGGVDIGPVHKKVLRSWLWDAGVIFIDGKEDGGMPPGAVGVVLKPEKILPRETRDRIAADLPQTVGDADAAGPASIPQDAEQPGIMPSEDGDETATAQSVAAPTTTADEAADEAPEVKRPARKRRRGWAAPV